MSLTRLVYISDATKRLTHAELTTLVSHCEAKNAERGITGLLIYSAGHFLQVLEGERLSLNSLYTRICQDPRHRETCRLSFKDTDTRLFARWGMQLMNIEMQKNLDRAQIDKKLLQLRLNRSASGAEDALALLKEFRDQLMATDQTAADAA